MTDQNYMPKEEKMNSSCAERGWNVKDVLEGRVFGKKRIAKPRTGMIDHVINGSFVKIMKRAEES